MLWLISTDDTFHLALILLLRKNWNYLKLDISLWNSGKKEDKLSSNTVSDAVSIL